MAIIHSLFAYVRPYRLVIWYDSGTFSQEIVDENYCNVQKNISHKGFLQP